MGIILKRDNKFVGIRWKLVSTYLLLLSIALFMMFNIFHISLKDNYIDEFKINLITQGSIIANQISKNYDNLDIETTYNYANNYIKETSAKINSRVLIIDYDKEVLIDSHDLLNGKSIENLDEIDIALDGKDAASLYNIKGLGNTMYVAVPIKSQSYKVLGVVLISSDARIIFERINDTMKNAILTSLLGIFITGIVSFIIADIISSPIKKITDAASSIAMGDFNKKIEVEGTDEISRLGNAFNLMTAKLYQVDEQRIKFVANVSHELRTPLASLKIMSEALLEEKENIKKEVVMDFLVDIDKEVDRLSKVIDSLLYLVNIEKKELELDMKLSYVNYLARNVIKKLNPIAEKNNINIHLVETDRVQIKLDKDKINQALINILGNAIKYTPENGDIYVRIFLSKMNEVVIEIEDTGIGIPKADIEHIFDRFYRADKARGKDSGGVGLGMSIAKQIINLHQGQITIQSKINKGTKISIILPKNIGV